MSKGFLFFCCACVILLFSIINLSIGPIVSRTVGTNWGRERIANIMSMNMMMQKKSGASMKIEKNIPINGL